MRKVVVLMLLVFAVIIVVGCSGGGTHQLDGKWKGADGYTCIFNGQEVSHYFPGSKEGEVGKLEASFKWKKDENTGKINFMTVNSRSVWQTCTLVNPDTLDCSIWKLKRISK